MDSIAGDIEEITATIWEALFEPELPLASGGVPDGLGGAVSIVVIDGARRAAVVTMFPTELAERLATSMLGSEAAPTQDEILDAVGELCNMIAGNVKAAVAGPSTLRPPHGAVTLTTAPLLQLPGVREITVVSFTCSGSVFTVSVLAVPKSWPYRSQGGVNDDVTDS